MAETDASDTDAAQAPKSFSIKSALIELVLATVIAVGSGALLAIVLLPAQPRPSGGAAGAVSAAKMSAEAKTCTTSAIALVDLPPIVTNLGSPTDVWVRVEAAIVVNARPTDHNDVLAAEIATDELAYLRTLAIAQLEGPIGLENVRQDLTDRAVVRSNVKVTELILKTLVLQ